MSDPPDTKTERETRQRQRERRRDKTEIQKSRAIQEPPREPQEPAKSAPGAAGGKAKAIRVTGGQGEMAVELPEGNSSYRRAIFHCKIKKIRVTGGQGEGVL